jgi:hypothetical protein
MLIVPAIIWRMRRVRARREPTPSFRRSVLPEIGVDRDSNARRRAVTPGRPAGPPGRVAARRSCPSGGLYPGPTPCCPPVLVAAMDHETMLENSGKQGA